MSDKTRRDLILRAIGQIEGINLTIVQANIKDALFCTVDILEAVVKAMDEDGK